MREPTIYYRETANHQLSPSETTWLREYGAGMQLFVGDQLKSARTHIGYHAPTLAIIACRKALDIPIEKYPFIKLLSEDVAAAVNADSPSLEAAYLLKGVRIADAAELAEIQERASAQISGSAATRWTETLTSLTNDITETGSVAHSTGIAALELTAARAEPSDGQGTLSNNQRNYYRIAASAFRRRRSMLRDSWEFPSTGAESDEIHAQLMTALTALTTHYLSNNMPVEGLARGELMRLTYEIDTLYASPETILQEVYRGRVVSSHASYMLEEMLTLLKQSYGLLARSSGFRERRYFKGEAAAIYTDDDGTITRVEGERPTQDKRPKPCNP